MRPVPSQLIGGKDQLDDYRDSSSNLGLNSYLMMAPLAPGKAKKSYRCGA